MQYIKTFGLRSYFSKYLSNESSKKPSHLFTITYFMTTADELNKSKTNFFAST